jgi:hypothetical protein
LNYQTERNAETAIEIDTYLFLDKAKPLLDQLNKSFGEYQEYYVNLSTLENGIRRYKEYQELASELKEFIDGSKPYFMAGISLLEVIKNLEKERNQLSISVMQYQAYEKGAEDKAKFILSLEHPCAEAMVLLSEISELSDEKEALLRDIYAYQHLKVQVVAATTYMERMQKEYDAIKAELKVCPTCGKEF